VGSRWSPLTQNPQAAPREGLRLDDLVILLRPVAVRGEELAVASSFTPYSRSSTAWPARPWQASSRHILSSIRLREFLKRAEWCSRTLSIHTAHLTQHAGSVEMIKTGSEFLLGPM
jgi:hypothetical protein